VDVEAVTGAVGEKMLTVLTKQKEEKKLERSMEKILDVDVWPELKGLFPIEEVSIMVEAFMMLLRTSFSLLPYQTWG